MAVVDLTNEWIIFILVTDWFAFSIPIGCYGCSYL